MSVKVGIIGAAGYAGAELVRLMCAHPDFELVAISSNADEKSAFSELYPSFIGADDLAFVRHDDPTFFNLDLVFLAVPHTAALTLVPALLEAGVSVVDLSADFRICDPCVYERWYGKHHSASELLSQRAFGLPELFAEDLNRAATELAAGQAQLIACAGCYPTASSLAAAPALYEGWVQEGTPIVIDAISGISGAGKGFSATTHFCSADENLCAYAPGTHRHAPEIEQILGVHERVVFTPHLAPLKRGLLSTVTLQLTDTARQTLSNQEVHARYCAFFEGCSFVHVLPEHQQAQSASVVGSNAAHISPVLDVRTGVLIVTCAIDNLVKGAAGQAVQCANLLFSLDERRGLSLRAYPV